MVAREANTSQQLTVQLLHTKSGTRVCLGQKNRRRRGEDNPDGGRNDYSVEAMRVTAIDERIGSLDCVAHAGHDRVTLRHSTRVSL
jgi:hypothetical protein